MVANKMFGLDIDFTMGITRVMYPKTGFFDRFMFATVIELLCTMSPVFVTFYFYYQVHKELKENNANGRGVNVMWYVVIQAICFGTGVMVDIVSMALQLDNPPFIVQFIASTFRRSWGFLNLMVYWFLRYTDEDDEGKEILIDDTHLLRDDRSSLSSRRGSELEM